MQSVRWRLKQNEIPIFCKLPKENKTNNKNVFTFLIYVFVFTLHAVPILFLFGIHFYKEALSFHYIHALIMFNHVNFGKHIRIHMLKIKKTPILKFHPRMKCLHVFFSFFSYRNEISSLSFWQGWVHPGTKFLLGNSISFITNFEPKKVFHF